MKNGDIGVALAYGFGDSVIAAHLIVETGATVVYNISHRWRFTEGLLDLLEPKLGFKRPSARAMGIDFESSYNPITSLASLRNLVAHQVHDIKSLRASRCFDFRSLAGPRPDIPGRYAVISGSTLGRDRVIQASIWASVATMLMRADIIPVLIGDDGIFKSSPFRYSYEADGIDLRNCTTVGESLSLLAHADACFCVANGVSVLAHEVGCRTFCVGAKKAERAYRNRYFTGPTEIRINYDRNLYLNEAEVAVRDWLKNKRTGSSTGGPLQLR